MTGARDGTIQPLGRGDRCSRPPPCRGPTGGIEEAAIDPSGRWLVAVGAGRRVALGPRVGRRPRASVIDRPSGALWSVAFSTDGTRLATAAEDGVVQLYDTNGWTRDGEPFTAGVDFLSVAFTPDGQRLLAGTGDGRVFMWDLADARARGFADRRARNERRLGVGDGPDRRPRRDREQRRHGQGLVAGRRASSWPSRSSTRGGARTLAAAAGVSWSADGASLYAGGSDGRIHEWNFATAVGGRRPRPSATTTGSPTPWPRPIGRVLVTLGRDQDVRVLGRRRAATGGDVDRRSRCARSSASRRRPDGAAVAVGDGDGNGPRAPGRRTTTSS